MDRLSDLPDNTIEAILECLPIHDAVRTNILSKNWRHKWETISKLHLDRSFLDCMRSSRKNPSICRNLTSIKYVGVVKNIMLQHQGPLNKFVIYIPALEATYEAEINLIVCCALRNGVRELSVEKADGRSHVLPSFFFSAAEHLILLELSNCVLKPPPLFKGFPNLEFLSLTSIKCRSLDTLASFISSCQELRRVKLDHLNDLDQHLCFYFVRIEYLEIVGHLRSISLHGVENLVSLSLELTNLSEGLSPKDYMLDNFGKLRRIKYLKLAGFCIDLLAVENFPEKLSPGLDHLDTIEVSGIDLSCFEELHSLLCLMRSSPNLQQLKISEFGSYIGGYAGEVFHRSEIQLYGVCCFQRLRTVDIDSFTKAGMMFIECLLRSSPMLETICVQPEQSLDNDEKLKALS